MSKTIKVIDLLNKIANGEEIPEKIKWKGIEFDYDKDLEDYCDDSYCSLLYKMVSGLRGLDILDYEVEIIEEQEEIDIQSIEEIESAMNGNECVIDNRIWTLNQVIKAVKQLDEKIKEKK